MLAHSMDPSVVGAVKALPARRRCGAGCSNLCRRRAGPRLAPFRFRKPGEALHGLSRGRFAPGARFDFETKQHGQNLVLHTKNAFITPMILFFLFAIRFRPVRSNQRRTRCLPLLLLTPES